MKLRIHYGMYNKEIEKKLKYVNMNIDNKNHSC